jgi:hypothetical protein
MKEAVIDYFKNAELLNWAFTAHLSSP